MTKGALAALRSPEQRLFVSVATIWELEIKQSNGKLDLTAEFWPTVESRVTELLPIEKVDALAAARLSPHHRDPFDRLIVAQALAGRLTMMTRDRALMAYGVPILAP